MEYRKFEDSYFLRLDPGEEILSSLMQLAKEEEIALAEVSGLGAIDELTVGVFYTDEKSYHSNDFKGYYEITSLTGTITRMGEQPYLHLHLSAGDRDGHVVGGHLNRARVSATAEIVIRCVKGKVQRKMSDEVGLNLFDFD